MKENGYTKHYAQHNITHKRLILLCVENEKQKGTTIGIPYDELDAETRAELIQIIDGPECQAVKDSWTVLSKKIFMEHPQYTALDYLTKAGFAKSYPVQDITVYYTPNDYIALTELIRQINEYEAKKYSNMNSTPFFDSVTPETQSTPDVAPSVSLNEIVSQPVQEPVKQEQNNQLDTLTTILMKMTDRLEDMCSKLDKLENSKSTSTTTKSTKKKTK